jgi:hypothetical protein
MGVPSGTAAQICRISWLARPVRRQLATAAARSWLS